MWTELSYTGMTQEEWDKQPGTLSEMTIEELDQLAKDLEEMF